MVRRETEQTRAQARAVRADSTLLRRQATALRDRAETLADHFVDTVRRHRGPDFEEPRETLTFHLGRLPASVPLARYRLQRWLRSRGVEPAEARDVTLAFSEACANAVEHPVRPRRYAFQVEATCTADEIRLAVRDYGSWRPGAGDPARGRGLWMIRQVMDHARVERTRDGTRIVMRRARTR